MIYDGLDLARLDVEERVERGLCLVPEQRELFGDMAVARQSAARRLFAPPRNGADATEPARKSTAAFRASPSAGARRRRRSPGGERQMLALGRALMAKPRLLLLDEPSLGLAPMMVREILRIVASLREVGVSILLVEQNARAALETADYGYVLETGEITHQGPAAALAQRPARGRDLSRRVDLMARAPYDDVVLAAPVTIPYARYSIRSAHWFLGRALAELLAERKDCRRRASTALRSRASRLRPIPRSA